MKKENSNPKISIIVPVYNSESYLKRCMDSILSQTFDDFECILVDDFSRDNSHRMCDDYAVQDPRIKVMHKIKNEGASLARKSGLEISVGEYIQFIDSDDWIEPDMVERMYKRAMSGNFDIVYCDYVCFDKKKSNVPQSFDIRGMDKQEIIISLITDRFMGMLWYKIFKRKLFENVIFPIFQFREDRIISIQLFLNAGKIGYEYSILYHYFINQKSLVLTHNRQKTNRKESYENFKLLNNIMMKRSDYNLYKILLIKEEIKYKLQCNTAIHLMTLILKAIIPYGFFKLCDYFEKWK